MNRLPALMLLCATLLASVSCTEDIDTSARYVFTQQTLLDYIRAGEDFSEYNAMLADVPISEYTKSSVATLLSTRGNFLVFAPTNEAIARYLKTNYDKGVITSPATKIADIADKAIADSLKAVIVKNSVMDFSDNTDVKMFINVMAPRTTETSAYTTVSNLNLRYLNIGQPTDTALVLKSGETKVIKAYPIEGALTFKCDIELYNGILHEMYEVVAPSSDDVMDIMSHCEQLTAFGNLLTLCGLQDTLRVYEDKLYHKLYWSNPSMYQPPKHATESVDAVGMEHRLIGFTIFPETNEVYKALGLLGDDGKVKLEDLRKYLESRQPSGLLQDDDYTNTDNWLNYFVTYHLLPMSIEFDHLVVHYNEVGYHWLSKESVPTIPITEHYTTMGQRRLLNITEGNDTVTHGKRLNFFAKMNRKHPMWIEELIDDGIFVDDPLNLGFTIPTPTNGMIYPIPELLVYTPETARRQGTERMRIDVTTLFPEMMTNRIRRRFGYVKNTGFTKNYPYITDMQWSDESNVYYHPGWDQPWHNFQGDEFNITGIYDIVIKMPPIPYSNTYELRFNISANFTRGLMQVYFGTNRDMLPATGIPIDMRLGGTRRYTGWGWDKWAPSYLGWELDTDDEAFNEDSDKRMRLHGFMKAPAGFCKRPIVGSFDVLNTMRNDCKSYDGADGAALRRILLRQELQAGETYYIRFKDVLGQQNSQFFLDFFELVPKEIYDNPILPEDIW